MLAMSIIIQRLKERLRKVAELREWRGRGRQRIGRRWFRVFGPRKRLRGRGGRCKSTLEALRPFVLYNGIDQVDFMII